MRLLACLLLLAARVATAGPTAAAWRDAEAKVRQRLADKHVTPIEVTAKKDATLGTAFWVRTETTGQLIVVRGAEIYDTRSDDAIAAILRADDQLHSHAISAPDFLYLERQLGHLPEVLGNPITEHVDKSLLPAWHYDKGGATFAVTSARKDPQGATNTKRIPITRATLAVSPSYALVWTTEATDAPIK